MLAAVLILCAYSVHAGLRGSLSSSMANSSDVHAGMMSGSRSLQDSCVDPGQADCKGWCPDADSPQWQIDDKCAKAACGSCCACASGCKQPGETGCKSWCATEDMPQWKIDQKCANSGCSACCACSSSEKTDCKDLLMNGQPTDPNLLKFQSMLNTRLPDGSFVGLRQWFAALTSTEADDCLTWLSALDMSGLSFWAQWDGQSSGMGGSTEGVSMHDGGYSNSVVTSQGGLDSFICQPSHCWEECPSDSRVCNHACLHEDWTRKFGERGFVVDGFAAVTAFGHGLHNMMGCGQCAAMRTMTDVKDQDGNPMYNYAVIMNVDTIENSAEMGIEQKATLQSNMKRNQWPQGWTNDDHVEYYGDMDRLPFDCQWVDCDTGVPMHSCDLSSLQGNPVPYLTADYYPPSYPEGSKVPTTDAFLNAKDASFDVQTPPKTGAMLDIASGAASCKQGRCIHCRCSKGQSQYQTTVEWVHGDCHTPPDCAAETARIRFDEGYPADERETYFCHGGYEGHWDTCV